MDIVKRKVPKLRFKEFRDEWKIKTYKKVFDITAGGDISKEHVSFTQTEKFKYPIYANAENNKGFYGYSDIYKVEENALTIAGRGVNIGIAHARNHKFYPIVRLLVLIPKHMSNNIKFFEYATNRLNIFVESTGVPQLTAPQISTYKVSFPDSEEQQKIASFLTAVDDKIQQLTKKKELLGKYKKGVMQKLFPSKDGQAPEIRFKDDEGNDYPDWEKKKLGNLCSFENGKAHEGVISDNGKYIVVNSKYISTNGNVKKYSDSQISPLYNGDLVMVMSDIPNGKALAKCYYIETNNTHTLNQRICVFRSKLIDTKFLYFILNRNKYYLAFDSGVGQTNLRKDEVLACPLRIPLAIEEQNKIADFLSSIDKKINSVNTQLEKTKEFKKGLLQQMFV